MNQKRQQQFPPSHHLLGRFDYDPGRWRPLYYGVKISVPVALDGVGRGSITINNEPYIMTRIMHKIQGETADPSTTGLYQDGQYDIEFRDEQSNYQNDDIAADLLFGSVGSGVGNGFFMPIPYPIPFAGNKTISFRVINRVLRALTSQAENFTVAIAMHGLADWGTFNPDRQ